MKAEAGRDDQVGAAKTGRNSGDAATCAEVDVATRSRTKAEVATTSLMDAVVERGNLGLAYRRVLANKGAAGVDALGVSEFKAHLQQHWTKIKAACWRASINRSRCAGWTFPSRKAGYAHSAYRRWWIDSSSRRCIQCCNRSSSQRSPMEATAFDRGAMRIRRYAKRASTWRKASAGW